MLPGSFSNGSVVEFATRVTVAGVDHPFVSVSLDGDMRSDLPSQLVQSSGGIDRSGAVVWQERSAVADRPVTPFREWGLGRPRRGDRVVVWVGDGVTEWPRFTGLIDETFGDVSGEMSSTLVSDIDPLTQDFTCEALLSRMSPLPGASEWRWGGLAPMFYADAAMRAGGFNTTPPTPASACLNAPLQGSLYPLPGTGAELTEGGAYGQVSATMLLWSAPWGLAASDLSAKYRPAFTRTPASPVQMSMMVSPAHQGSASLTVYYGSRWVRIWVTEGRQVHVLTDATDPVPVCTLSGAEFASAQHVMMLLKGGTVTLRADNGATASGSLGSLGSASMSEIDLNARTGARIAGVRVSHPEPWQEFIDLGFSPSARIHAGAGSTTTWGVINAHPRVEAREAEGFLEDAASQTLSAMWVDEEGVLHFAPSGAIRQAPPVQTVTTSRDVLAMSWSDRVLSVASRVTVSYLHPSLSSGTAQSVEVARGARRVLARGDVDEEVYRPGQDEDWYGVDGTLTRLPGTVGWSHYNTGVGSMGGATYYLGENVATGTQGGGLDITMSKTGLAEWTVVHDAASVGAGVTAETMTYPTVTGTGLWARNTSTPLPVIRAWGRVEWVQRETTTAVDSVGPHLRVDLGGAATVDTAQRVRDYLRGLIEAAVPRITRLDARPDPRRQIGDVITLDSPDFLGASIRCLITGISESMSRDGYTQQLTLDVLSVATTSLSWAEWEQAFPGTLTFAQWRALRSADDTYTDFNTTPLEGA